MRMMLCVLALAILAMPVAATVDLERLCDRDAIPAIRAAACRVLEMDAEALQRWIGRLWPLGINVLEAMGMGLLPPEDAPPHSYVELDDSEEASFALQLVLGSKLIGAYEYDLPLWDLQAFTLDGDERAAQALTVRLIEYDDVDLWWVWKELAIRVLWQESELLTDAYLRAWMFLALELEEPLELPLRNELSGTSWILVEIDGEPPLPDVTITLNFEDGRLWGSDGCNTYWGFYLIYGTRLEVIDSMTSTLMWCGQEIMNQAGAYCGVLMQQPSFRIDEGQLELVDSEGELLAVFDPA